MRTINLEEISYYVFCPQREWYRKNAPGISDLEARYKIAIRKVIVHFFTEAMNGKILNYTALRREWSKYWQGTPILTDRHISKTGRSLLNASLSDEEIYIFKGLEVLKALITMTAAKTMKIFMVDEPFSVDVDGITIEGRIDGAFSFSNRHDQAMAQHDRIYVMKWSDNKDEDKKHNIVHSFLIDLVSKRMNKPIDGLIIYPLILGNSRGLRVIKTPEVLEEDMKQISNVAKALSQDIYYKHIGPQCYAYCSHVNRCLGEKVTTSKHAKVGKSIEKTGIGIKREY